MKTNPSSFFLTSYNLSFKEAALCLLSGFHCFPFAVRHFEMADMDESYSLAHKSIAILESIPIIGLITALIERICALAFSFFKPTSAAQTQSSNHESNIYATIDALESNLYLGSLDHCPYNASVLKLSNNKIKVVKYNSWESYSYNQSQIRNYLAKNWEQIEPLLTSVKAMRNVAHIFHYHHFNATTSVTRSELSKKTDVLSWGIPQLMNVGLSFKQSKQICLKEPDETEKLVRGLVEIFNQASGQMKIKLFKTYFKFNSQEEIKLNHQLVDSFNKVYKHFGDIHRSKAENWLTYLLEKICLDPGLDLIGNFIKNPKKISMVWSHCNKCKLSEKDILEILTNFNFDGLEVGDSIIKDVDLIIKIYSTPSFAKIKEKWVTYKQKAEAPRDMDDRTGYGRPPRGPPRPADVCMFFGKFKIEQIPIRTI